MPSQTRQLDPFRPCQASQGPWKAARGTIFRRTTRKSSRSAKRFYEKFLPPRA